MKPVTSLEFWPELERVFPHLKGREFIHASIEFTPGEIVKLNLTEIVSLDEAKAITESLHGTRRP